VHITALSGVHAGTVPTVTLRVTAGHRLPTGRMGLEPTVPPLQGTRVGYPALLPCLPGGPRNDVD